MTRRRTLFHIFSVILLATGIFVGYLYKLGGTQTTSTANAIGALRIVSATETNISDTDSDGLSDWQEGVWGSDPNDPDSDGDGMTDGDEVAADRDPTVAGPDDDLFAYIDFVPEHLKESNYSKAQREYLEEMLKDIQSEVGPATIMSLIDQEEASIKDFDSRYTLKDLNTFPSQNTEDLRRYGNELGKIFATYGDSRKYPYNEIELLVEMMNKQDWSDSPKLQIQVLLYAKLSEELLNMEVPLELAENHLAFINDYDVISRCINGFMTISTKPITSKMAYEQYLSTEAHVKVAYTSLAGWFQNKNIVFNRTDPGYVFTGLTDYFKRNTK